MAAILPAVISDSAPAQAVAIANAISDAAQSSDGATVAAIAEALSPSTAGVVANVTQSVNSAITGVANSRMAALGRSAGDVFTGGSAWAQVIYNNVEQKATGNTSHMDADSYGITVGVDGKLNDNLTLGVGFGFTKTDADAGAHDVDVDSYSLFGYGEYKTNGWYVNGTATAMRGRYDETKAPAGVRLSSKYDTTVLGISANAGYTLDCGLSPEVGLRYLWTHQETYNDGVQDIDTDNTDLLTLALGAKFERTFEQNDWSFKPSVRLAATYDVVADDTNSAVRVLGGGTYRVVAEHQKRAALETGLGIEATKGDWTFAVSYDGEFRDHYRSHTGAVKVKYSF